MNYKNIIFEVKGGIAYITMSRPEAMNALNTDTLDELADVFSHINDDDQVGVVILTGAGKAFVAGADISQMSKLNTIEGRAYMIKGQKVMSLIENAEKPVIAVVNGFALGGGCELAMACDIRLASEKAKFGQPEVNLGIIPGFGGTQRLPRLVGKGMAKYLTFSAEIIDANEALRIGLVERVYPMEKLMEEAEKLANAILTKSQFAVRMAKAAINRGLDMDIDSGIAHEAEVSAVVFGFEDRTEGMNAFLDKRPASFRKLGEISAK